MPFSPNNSVKAISFDADGTLIGTFAHSSRGFENFFIHAAKSRGVHITLDDLEPILAYAKEETAKWRESGFQPYANEENSRRYWLWFYEEVFSEMDLPDPKDTAHEFLERFEAGEFTTLFPDVLPALENFRGLGIPMIVISNYSPILERFLAKLGIANFFKAALISGITGVEKPDPAIYAMGAEALGLPPAEILHVGNDLEEDYHAPIRAGMQAILLDRNHALTDPQITKIHSLSEMGAFPGDSPKGTVPGKRPATSQCLKSGLS